MEYALGVVHKPLALENRREVDEEPWAPKGGFSHVFLGAISPSGNPENSGLAK